VKQADGFGTVITLSVSEAIINAVLKEYKHKDDICGRIVDPTYPVRDGEITHKVECLTCAYVLSYDSEHPGLRIINNLELHK